MKKIMLISILFVCFMSSIVFGKGQSQKENLVVVATNPEWPPMEFINENKELVGFDIDIIRAIADIEGLEVKLISTAWDGIFAGLINGDYDTIISAVTITKERKKSVGFSDPYFNAGQILAVQKKNAAKVSSLVDLVGKQVGVQIGTTGFEVVKKQKGVIVKTYDSLGPAVEELAQGTIDGIVADTPLVSEYLLRNKKYKDKFTVVGEQMTSEEYGIVVNKENTELLQKINTGLAKIKENGTYDKLLAKWALSK